MTAQAGDTTSDSKAALRRELRQQRRGIPAAERVRAATAAARHLARLPEFRRARRVAVYLEHGAELPTAPLIARCADAGIEVCVPAARADRSMRFVVLPPGGRLRRGALGIRVPAARTVPRTLAELDLVVLPLVGFDRDGRRLGTGGGYYDRHLAARRGRRPLLVGYGYAQQEVPALPQDPWDVRLDAVVTEQGARRWPTG